MTHYEEHHQKAMTPENQLMSPQEKIDRRAFPQRFGDLDEKKEFFRKGNSEGCLLLNHSSRQN